MSDAFAAERDYESMPDERIVRRCRRGDDDAWRELVRRFSRYVYAITTQCYRLSSEDAEDVFQEVWARTYTNLDRLRPAAELTTTVLGGYERMLEHIAVHRYFMGLDFQRDVSESEAVEHWYDTVYLPVVRVVGESGVMSAFVVATESRL